MRDMHELDPEVKEHVRFVPCHRIEDVLAVALVQPEAAKVAPVSHNVPNYIPVATGTSRAPATSFTEVK
jgi:hypothetical protein